MTFNPREKKIVGITVGVLTLAAVYYGMYLPVKGRGETLDQQIRVVQERLRKTRLNIEKDADLERSYAIEFAAYKQQDTDEQMMSALLSEIETAAGGVGMHVTEMKPQRVKKAGPYNHFSVSLVLDGGLPELMQFIATIQNPPHQFLVDNMTLTRKAPQEQVLRCELIVTRISLP